jgi:hypothetical protein
LTKDELIKVIGRVVCNEPECEDPAFPPTSKCLDHNGFKWEPRKRSQWYDLSDGSYRRKRAPTA